MISASDRFDIAFIGHVCFDEVIPYGGKPRVAPGSAVLCGALAAARVGKKVAVVTRMASEDQAILEPMLQNGIKVHSTTTLETTYMKVVHSSADVDDRQIYQLANAGFFSLADIPPLKARQVHLAGITDQEFDLDFIGGLKERDFAAVGGYAKFCAPGGSGHASYCVRRCSQKERNRKPDGYGQVGHRGSQSTDRHRRSGTGSHDIGRLGLPRNSDHQGRGGFSSCKSEKRILRSSQTRAWLAGRDVVTPSLRPIWPTAWITR